MARPLARRHTIKVRLTDEELATLEARARGAALAPSIAAAALGAPMEPAPAALEPTRPPASPAEWRTRMAAALDATDAVVASGGKLPLALGPVRAALVALRGAVRTS